jgi:hypothetical protein
MRRRDLILGVGSTALAATAGCTGNSNSGTNQNNSQTNDGELPPPDEIDYTGVTFDLPNGSGEAQNIGEASQIIVEELDRSIYNSSEGFPDETERNIGPSGSYVSLELVGRGESPDVA